MLLERQQCMPVAECARAREIQIIGVQLRQCRLDRNISRQVPHQVREELLGTEIDGGPRNTCGANELVNVHAGRIRDKRGQS
ncbi:MAG TPA: hypothetical protein VLM79_00810 [Kofleriaceae bacterium]|nr:hypothetical protein [Kofleriaceae bacterium]